MSALVFYFQSVVALVTIAIVGAVTVELLFYL